MIWIGNMAYLLFLASISCLAGFMGGLTGTGGIIMPPLMIEVYGIGPHLAMGMAQASYILPSILAVGMFLRKGRFDWGVAIPISVSGCAASFFAARYCKPHVDPALLSIFFAICIMLSGALMLKKGTPVPNAILEPPWRGPVLVAMGALVGFMAGITGSGSSAILVPVMAFLGLEMLSVLGACQFFAVLSSASGTVGNAMNMSIGALQVACMVAGQFLGIWFGVGLAQRIDTNRLKRCVGVVCVLAGLFIMCEGVSAVFFKSA